jgi:glycosyltransferase involved in cell wall biosynthesis
VRLAFIVQRYGPEILGGAEYLCRLTAERMAQRHDVEVLTTCARDYVTWKNEYAEGSDRIRGVTVRRFASTETRDIESFNRFSDWIYHNPHTPEDELTWLRLQGPWCPALLEHVARHHQSYEVLIFVTYLYAPTVLGLRIAPERSILLPTAHDEPAIHLGLYKEMFGLPGGIAFLTDVERRFVTTHFPVRAIAEETVGCGVDLLSGERRERRSGSGAISDGPLHDTDVSTRSFEDHQPLPSHITERGAVFRRRHRLHGPLVLYGGRIDPGKGCEELIEYFSAYVAQGGDATLALMGLKLMKLPDEPHIRFAGLLSERERLYALEAATVVVVPSPYESLSLLALEAFAVGTPVLANARSDVLVEHCVQSNGGLYYADGDEFVAALNLLLSDVRLRSAMGRNGREYVRRNYRWDVVLAKYERMIAKVRAGG